MSFIQFIQEWNQTKVMDRFVTIVSEEVNLDMIELARGKKNLHFMKSKEYQNKFMEKVEYLLPKFTYKEWLIILNVEGNYQKQSGKKEEDVRQNLSHFLLEHYKDVYQIIDLELYDEFNQKESPLVTLVLGQDVLLNQELVSIVLFYYEDGSRMCYAPNTGQRVVVENVIIKPQSSIITLHQKKEKKLDRLRKWFQGIFFEEE